jgi:hypothetical protein
VRGDESAEGRRKARGELRGRGEDGKSGREEKARYIPIVEKDCLPTMKSLRRRGSQADKSGRRKQ